MAILKLPVSDGFFYTEQVILQASAYTFTYRFNSRMQAWVLDITGPDGQILLTGLVIRESVALTDRFVNRVLGLPIGMIICIDTTMKDREPGVSLLGNDCQMFYVER